MELGDADLDVIVSSSRRSRTKAGRSGEREPGRSATGTR